MRSHPRQKIGRNDPCPCGSGKKYKHCCLENGAASIDNDTEDSPWRRQRVASDRLTDEMMKFAARKFGEHIGEAWEDFNQLDFPEPIDEFPGEQQIFFPYFLFDWDPDRPRFRRGQRCKPGVVAQAYMEEKAPRLPELERLILDLSVSEVISFYEIVRCEPGHGMLLRDVLIGGETEVEEHSASRTMRQGDLVYGQLCPLPEVTTVSRLAPIAIPPGRKADVIGLRARLRRKIAKQNRELCGEHLIRYAEEIRSTYLSIRDALHTPPKLCNTDGEPLALHTLTYRIGSAQVAFDALAPLVWGQSKEELLDGAEVDGDGTLRGVNFEWRKKGNKLHKTWDNTILGHMRISGQTLVVEVNSAQRAAKISAEIERRLGMLAVHRSTSVRTAEQMLEDSKQTGSAGAASAGAQGNNRVTDPEVLRQFQKMMQREAEAWVHHKLPVLGGLTPLQAVKHPDGKEVVEALLLDWERKDEAASYTGGLHTDIKAIRRMLKL